MYQGKCLIAAIAITILTGCASQSGHSPREFGPRDSVSLDSVTDLLHYNNKLNDYAYGEYVNALQLARSAYEEKRDGETQLRLAIALMRHDSNDALRQYIEAERLLNAYIKDSKHKLFDADYRALAQLLLNMNLSWQHLHGQLRAARVATADARQKLEELKSIEMRLNHPVQRFQ
ncbi:hypothetical protein [Litorivivens sp.]|uniref:hypothetical protein n=1 Tax=Litorivivens sp. TaxID=2020868 RepID=UPI003564364E